MSWMIGIFGQVLFMLLKPQPLVDVLRIVDSEKELAMGYIYGAMDSTKELIAKTLGGEEYHDGDGDGDGNGNGANNFEYDLSNNPNSFDE